MEVLRTVSEMQARSRAVRQAGKTIVLVPTMGFLHDGHISLMKAGRRRGDFLVVSIFVNPTQFGAGEDYVDYPRDLAGDSQKSSRAGVDVIFTPAAGEMYPSDYQTYVTVESITQNLCGMSRPTHFRGVTTVVAKLFTIVQPHVAIFGEKDYQQLVTIRQMVKDLNFDVEIVGAPIVREADGVAMSSRNKYLSPKEREAARCLSRSLALAQELFEHGERSALKIIQTATALITAEPSATIDYVKVCDPDSIEDIEKIEDSALVALAVRIGKTRLIDNRILKGSH